MNIEKSIKKITNERVEFLKKHFNQCPKIIYVNNNFIKEMEEYYYKTNYSYPVDPLDGFICAIECMQVKEDNTLKDWEFRLE